MIRALDVFLDDRAEPWDLSARVRRRLFSLTSRAASRYMALRSRFGRRPLIDANCDVTVSLTTYGLRIANVDRTIESIGRGSTKPSRIVLWLDDMNAFQNLPQRLIRQMSRGLEIKLTENLGPHTKYFPLISASESTDSAFATADDDIIYPRSWLAQLVRAERTTPSHIVCHRAHRMIARDDQLVPYDEWPSVHVSTAHPSVFATGVGGVLYPPDMIDALRSAGKGFTDLCPLADDVWLHHVALTSGIPVRQISSRPRHFWITPGSQNFKLMDRNLGGGNDKAISRMYSDAEVRELRQ